MAKKGFLDISMNERDDKLKISNPDAEPTPADLGVVRMDISQARYLRDFLNRNLPYWDDER